MNVLLAIDIGGSHSRAALISESLEILKLDSITTNPDDPADTLRRISEMVHKLAGRQKIIAAGVAIAGVVTDGYLAGAGNLAGWINRDIWRDFTDMLGGVQVTVSSMTVQRRR